jgi:hypothetical protein
MAISSCSILPSQAALRLFLGFVSSFGGVPVAGDSFALNPVTNFCSRWYTQCMSVPMDPQKPGYPRLLIISTQLS